jgi:hypothetical protein
MVVLGLSYTITEQKQNGRQQQALRGLYQPRHTRLDQLSAGKGYTGITGQDTIGIADKQVGRSTDT